MKPSTTDDVIHLLEAHSTSAALGAAMELGLFWLLKERPLSAADVAQALDIPTNRCRQWLQILGQTGLVEQVSAGYALSPTAQTAILDVYSRETWTFLAGEYRERSPVVQDLALHIRNPGSVWAALGLTPPDYFAQIAEDPERARRFTRMLCEIHQPLAEELAEFLDMDGVYRLMDLGGGSGVVSLALLRRYPQLSAVVVDIPYVCAAGREIAAENSMEERIVYQELDFLHDELPSGFDVVLQCDVGAFGESELQKCWRALNPGGRLIIVDQFAPTSGAVPESWLYWGFLASLENPGFTLRTTADIRARLTEAGFHLLSERALPPSEVLRWSRDWIVIEAGK